MTNVSLGTKCESDETCPQSGKWEATYLYNGKKVTDMDEDYKWHEQGDVFRQWNGKTVSWELVEYKE